MQIIHHVTWRPTEAEIAELLALGFDASSPSGLLTLEVDEADSRWPSVQVLAGPHAVDMVFTRASETERRGAAWLCMLADGHRGYPQPEDGFKAATYDLRGYCPACGLGATQQAPFRFRRDPALRPNRVLQLNWVFDVFFTSTATWEQLFRPFGVTCRPAVLHRSGEILPSLVQLEAPEAPALLQLEGHAAEACIRCRRRKYSPYTRGFLPRFAGSPPTAHMVRSRESFGSGGNAYREVLISGPLYEALYTARLRGAHFRPTAQPAGSDAAAG